MNQVVTLGCRLNAYESEVIKQNLDKAGRTDCIVVNSCAVTKEAERQTRQTIRKLKRENPGMEIIVTGCAAQINPGQFELMPEVAKVIGNEEKMQSKFFEHHHEEKVAVNDIMSITETAGHLVSSFEGKARAFLQIQNGCNHRCTFCRIPYGRGNSRSVPIGAIVDQARKVIESGYHEVVLTGVDISDYGLDLPGSPTLGQMLRRLLGLVTDLKRLRLSSIDVAEIDEDLFELIATDKRIMPHLHISLQAGDNMVLKRMKRRHNREQVIEFCDKLRARRPEVAFGADIIAGFPTETDEMFQNTKNLIAEAGIQYNHIFPYSAVEGTPAARMPQVLSAIRKERARILRETGEEELKRFLPKNIGLVTTVIVEKDGIGRAENFTTVKIAGNYEPGTLLTMLIKDIEDDKLIGEIFI